MLLRPCCISWTPAPLTLVACQVRVQLTSLPPSPSAYITGFVLAVLSHLQEGTRTGAIDPATAANLSASLMSGSTTPLDALTQALGMGTAAGAAPLVPGTLTHDYEFAAVELVKPTRMNKVGSRHEHDLHGCGAA